ncbi:hypothetical protein [Elizabethkingia sp. JS20170427COW]|uniref:hypothetical protein n=1 Tax=Elizabethkingia sp. JS20170427COW TaxID=2583851 RepID=UPI0011109076|nr:hypothetical protein [Elizabethkingia sp. JS20170427COW]QCX52499.1 hypothetical protein FGE20_01430 [Elizabethkingia sp. JS20170427COW]
MEKGHVKPVFFISDWNGGANDAGFEIITDNITLNRKLQQHAGTIELQIDQPATQPKQYQIPKGEKIVFYSFGMRRSGSYKVQGIDSLQLVGKTLVVYLPKARSQEGVNQIQVISYPWVAFGVPEKYQFDTIEFK